MENSLAPIIIFTYRRHIHKTIASLLSNELAKDSNLYIFSDGNKNNIDLQDVLEVRDYLKTIEGFQNIKIIESSNNKGLANSIIDGVSEIVSKYEKVIVLEDDLILSKDFLQYMNDALNYYKYDKRIWSISAYGPNLPCLKNYGDDLYLSVRGSSWGWATWRDQWETVDWDIKDWDEFKRNKNFKKELNLGGNDMYKMLELQMLGKIDSWAIRWCYSQFMLKKYTVFPKQTKSINDGFSDNKGTHNTGVYNKLSLELNDKAVNFQKLHVDHSMIQCFQEFHNLSFTTQIGYFLKKYGGYSFAKKIYRIIKS